MTKRRRTNGPPPFYFISRFNLRSTCKQLVSAASSRACWNLSAAFDRRWNMGGRKPARSHQNLRKLPELVQGQYRISTGPVQKPAIDKPDTTNLLETNPLYLARSNCSSPKESTNDMAKAQFHPLRKHLRGKIHGLVFRLSHNGNNLLGKRFCWDVEHRRALQESRKSKKKK